MFQNTNFKILTGDCLELLKNIPDKSIDLVLCDPPFAVTALEWDRIIPFESLWFELERVITENGVVALMASQPFTTHLASSNLKLFKYEWIWEKNFSTNFFHAKRQPLRKHESILIFYKKSGKYYPQKTTGHKPTQSAKGSSSGKLWHGDNKRDYLGGDTERYPSSILKFKAVDPKLRVHPTQKPVALLEYLIKTYTQEGEMVLDFAAGSFSTAVACLNTNRNFIGMEINPEYVEIGKKRIQEVLDSQK